MLNLLHRRKTYRVAFLLGWGCLLSVAAPVARAQEKKEPGKADLLLSKSEELTADDEKDTRPGTRKSYRKLYTIKLTEGMAYRIDLTSKDFDTILRLENAAGKQVAYNDDVDENITDSRILHVAVRTGEYQIIVTSYKPAKTGAFLLEVKQATAAEAAEARVQARLDAFAESPPAEQKKIVAEVTKDLLAKGGNLTIKDAQLAAQLAMQIDETDIDFARATCRSFAKIFEGASEKQLAGLSKYLEGTLLKNLDKIGQELEISGKTTEGKAFDLKDFKGKVVLVDFWATWCGPCVEEIPNIMDAYKKYRSKGFEVIGVSLDRDDDDIVKFVKERKVPWASINISDSEKLADKYGVNSIPYPILVGRDGRIVSMRARGPLLERLLERLVNEKK